MPPPPRDQEHRRTEQELEYPGEGVVAPVQPLPGGRADENRNEQGDRLAEQKA
jgi:hypothetical protein